MQLWRGTISASCCQCLSQRKDEYGMHEPTAMTSTQCKQLVTDVTRSGVGIVKQKRGQEYMSGVSGIAAQTTNNAR